VSTLGRVRSRNTGKLAVVHSPAAGSHATLGVSLSKVGHKRTRYSVVALVLESFTGGLAFSVSGGENGVAVVCVGADLGCDVQCDGESAGGYVWGWGEGCSDNVCAAGRGVWLDVDDSAGGGVLVFDADDCSAAREGVCGESVAACPSLSGRISANEKMFTFMHVYSLVLGAIPSKDGSVSPRFRLAFPPVALRGGKSQPFYSLKLLRVIRVHLRSFGLFGTAAVSSNRAVQSSNSQRRSKQVCFALSIPSLTYDFHPSGWEARCQSYRFRHREVAAPVGGVPIGDLTREYGHFSSSPRCSLGIRLAQ